MNGRAPRPISRAFSGVLALVLLTAIPGVAIASLPSHPAPTHECCAAPEAMLPSANCETAPCCIEKPAPKSPSVTTGAVPAPVLVASDVVALAMPAAPLRSDARRPIPPCARSAPLHILLATLLI